MRRDNITNQYRELPLLLLLLLSVSLILGYGARTRLPWFTGGELPPAATTAGYPQTAEWEKLQDIKGYIEEFYNGPIVDTVLLEGALKGMVRSLEDGGGQYFNAREFTDILDRSKKSRGTGIHLGVQDDRIIVIRVDKDSQAEKSGIMPGDIIFKINNRVYDGSEIESARNTQLSLERRSVDLHILRGDEQMELTVRLRLLVDQPIRAMLREDVAILRLPSFRDGIEGEMDLILDRLIAAGAKSLILDLRSMPAGEITEAVNVAANFVPSGQTVTRIRDTRGTTRDFISQDGAYQDLQLVVLINGLTEGTAEFVAGALRQQAGALLIGEPSMGEGRVFTFINLPEGEGIKLATGYFLLPDDQPIQNQAILPDQVVPGTPLYAQNLIQPGDLQMQAALEAARKLSADKP